jgi:hypothetical protein
MHVSVSAISFLSALEPEPLELDQHEAVGAGAAYRNVAGSTKMMRLLAEVKNRNALLS